MVKSPKTMPGDDCGTDHELLVATIQVKLKKTKKPEIENMYNLCDIPERNAVEIKNIFSITKARKPKNSKLKSLTKYILPN